MARALNLVELKRRIELDGIERTKFHLQEAIQQKHLGYDDFSVRDLYRGLVGEEHYRRLERRHMGGVLEATAGAVDLAAFTNITGQLVFNKVKERYKDPEFLWPQLFDEIQTQFLNGELIPGIGRVGDKAEYVTEGQPYPTVGLNEEYIQTQPLKKRGFIVPVTREIIVADRTGLLMREAGETSYWEGLNTEKIALRVALGVVNNYKRNGVASNTYLTSGSYVNKSSTTLIDWTSVQAAELLFDVITDPNTGELISVPVDTIIVPSALKRTAHRILQASEIALVDNTASATTNRTFSPNELREGFFGQAPYRMLSTSHVKEATGSTTAWFIGAPKKAFLRLYAWDIETMQAPANSESEFTQDIVTRFKVTVMDNFQVIEPRQMVQGNS